MIDTNFDFQKNIPSLKKAMVFLRKIDPNCRRGTISRSGRRIVLYFGETELIKFSYNTETLYVTYKDGRGEKPKKTPSKPQYYILHIEGIDKPEYLKNIYEHSYTTKKGDAMRVREQDLFHVKKVLAEEGFAQWAINSPSTYVKITSGKGKFFHKLK